MLSEHMKEKHTENFPCDVCSYMAYSEQDLNRHLQNSHSFTRVSRKRTGHSNEERKMNGICIYWNNGFCQYEKLCRFSHVEIPQCHFDGQCRNVNCRFFHTKPNSQVPAKPFLGRRSLQNNPNQSQWRHVQGAQRGPGPRK